MSLGPGTLGSEFRKEWPVGRLVVRLTHLEISSQADPEIGVVLYKRTRGHLMEKAYVLNNSALRCLPDIPALLLNMGTNFAPEHLAEMFETHRPTMQRLELRFRPYVEQASYYQFLKGTITSVQIQ